MYRVAINGFGRIGRNVLRAFFESDGREFPYEIVAINDLGKAEVNAHLLKFDTVHGRFNRSVSATANELIVGNQRIAYVSERDPSRLPWSELKVDLVLECTGLFTDRDSAMRHVKAGAKQVLISAPGSDADATIVYGVNHQKLLAEHQIVSNASCTTNCLAPIALALNDAFGIESGLVTTIHAYTNDQVLTDSYHSDPRRARSAVSSMIPTKTGAAAAISKVIPELAGRLDGLAVRVPIANTSLVDLTFQAQKQVTVDAVNQVLKEAAFGRLFNVMAVNELPLVSSDFNHSSSSSIVDLTQTQVVGRSAKVLAWYDNEWGFANRMLDTARVIAKLHPSDAAPSKIASCIAADHLSTQELAGAV